MSIKTIVVCDECGADATVETQVHAVCQSCRAGVKELTAVKIENAALKEANAAVCEALEMTRKELESVEARLEGAAQDAEYWERSTR
jgi:hypothetical protein